MDKQTEVTALRNLITDLWEMRSMPKGYFPYRTLRERTYRRSDAEVRHSYRWEHVYQSYSERLFSEWIKPNHPSHIDGKMQTLGLSIWADLFYMKMKIMVEGGHNKELLDKHVTADNLTIWMRKRVTQPFCSRTGKRLMEDYLEKQK